MTAAESPEELLRRVLSPLQRQRDAVRRAAADVDGTFVTLGDALGELVGDGSSLAERARELDGFVREKTALVGAYQLFKKSVDLAEANIERTEEIEAGLVEVTAKLHRTGELREAFGDAVRMFWMLATAIRIEAARLPAGEREGILHLVEGMNQVHGQLKSIVGEQFAGLDAINKRLLEIGGHADVLCAENRRCVRDSWTQLRALLDSFQAALDGVSSFCDDTAAQTLEMRACFDEILVALQFQDIVRQKLEHVGAACEQALLPVEGEPLELHLAFLHHLALLQEAQLGEALRDLTRAERTILDNAARLLASSGHALRTTRELHAGIVGALRGSSAAERFIATLDELHHTISSTSGIANEVSVAVERVRLQVLEQGRAMGKFTYDLRRIALNAQIHAARVSSGHALEVLAAESRSNSEETRALTERLLADVRAAMPTLERVRATLDDLLSLSGREAPALSAESREVSAEVDAMVTLASGSFVATEASFEALRGKVQFSVAGVAFGARVVGRLEEAQRCFAWVSRLTEPWAERGANDPRIAERVRALRTTYVMRDQRVVHDAVTTELFGTPGGDVDLPPMAPVAATASELGDNVELF